MGKNLTTNQKAQILKSQLKTRILVTINLDSGPLKILENDTQESLIIGNNDYLTKMVKRSDIEKTTDGTLEKMTISISNICKDISALIANEGDVLTNRYCKVEEVIFNDDDTTIIDNPVLLFDGTINNISLNAISFNFDVERKFRSYATISPNMIYDVNCQFKFKDCRCQYNGNATKCNKTLSSCQSLGNVCNFGGFPSIISQ